MSLPLVSIVVPNYNNIQCLNELIDCLKNQTFKFWELILVDDGSTDGSFENALKQSADDYRIHVYKRERQPKGGQTCRNIGYENSKGEYVIFFDSDDLISENCLGQRVKFMNAHPELDFAVFPTHSFKPRKNYGELRDTDVRWGNRFKGDPIDKFLRNEYPYLVVSCIFKRSSILSIKWKEDIPVRQDLVYNLSVLFSGLSFDFCDAADYDYFYRVEYTNTNVSKTMTTPQKYKGMLTVFNFCYDNIERFGIDRKNKYKNSIEHFIVNYGGQISSTGNKDMCDDYLLYCKSHCSSLLYYRLKMVYKVLLSLKLYKNELISLFIFMIFFWHKFYFDLMKKGFVKVISLGKYKDE